VPRKPRSDRVSKPDPPDKPLPWERQPEESDPAWEAFVIYRDMLVIEHDGAISGRRSIREVARREGKAASLMDKWSVRHKWRLRVEAYDADLDRDRRAVLRTEAISAVREHATIATDYVRAIRMPLAALFKPQRLLGPSGHQLVNEDGVALTRDRTDDLEGETTASLMLLLKTIGMLLPTVIEIRMEALGNPNEPLPEVPEWGMGEEERAELVSSDRMLDLLRAADEAGLLDASALAEAQLAIEAHAAEQAEPEPVEA
jgi:hypothetical protein